MKSKHITEILNENRFADLNETDLAAVNFHIKDCPSCEKSFRAAKFSSSLLKTRASLESPAPTPFFQAKVLNALRAKQNLQKPIEAFRRWWQASAAMVGFMVVTALCLVGASLIAPSASSEEAQTGTNFNLYSTDSVILNQKSPRDLTNEQVFQVIYNPRSDYKK